MQRGLSVLAIDMDREAVESIKEEVDQALIMDSTDENALFEARINEMPTVVCAIGNQHIEHSIMTTALLRQLGVPRIIARSGGQLHARILRQVGASEVINPEEAMGRRVAYQIASPGISEALPLAEGVCVAEMPVPKAFVGRNLAKLNVRRRYSVNVIGVQRPDSSASEADKEKRRHLILNISPTDEFQSGDTMVVIGREADVSALGTLS
jgi:trk system potassium uptake protein TrkA